MRKFLSGSIVALAVVVSGPAFTADVGARPQPYAAPAAAPTWQGCYVGANGGWVQGRSRFDWGPGSGFVGPNILSQFGGNDLDSSGGTAGGQFGCNSQTGPFVVGFETDVQWTDIDKAVSAVFPGCAACGTGGAAVVAESYFEHIRSNWNTTSRLRFGYAFGDLWLYGTGGFGVAHVTVDDSVAFFAGPGGTLSSVNTVSDTKNKFGWVVGAGGEWMFAPRWSVKLEYLHLDFGNFSTVSSNVGVGGVAGVPAAFILHNHKLTEDLVRVGINYQFGSLFW